LSTMQPPGVIHIAALDVGKLCAAAVAGSSKRRRLLFAGDGRQSV